MLDRNQRAWVSKLAEHRPRPGDLVITREVSHPCVRYTIGRLDKPPQLSCENRDKALKIARTYAAKEAVGIWENAAGEFTSLAPRGYGES